MKYIEYDGDLSSEDTAVIPRTTTPLKFVGVVTDSRCVNDVMILKKGYEDLVGQHVDIWI
jgi:hypothetical protein